MPAKTTPGTVIGASWIGQPGDGFTAPPNSAKWQRMIGS